MNYMEEVARLLGVELEVAVIYLKTGYGRT